MEYAIIEADILPELRKDSKSLSSIMLQKEYSKQFSGNVTLEKTNMLNERIYEFEIKSAKDFGKPISNAENNNNIELIETMQPLQKKRRTKRLAKSAINPNTINPKATKSNQDNVFRNIDIKNPSLVKNSGLYGLISKFYLIQKLIKILRTSTNLSSPSFFHSNILEIINDLAFDKNGWSNKGELFFSKGLSKSFTRTKIENCFKNILNNTYFYFTIPTLHPTKTMRNLWDAFHFAIILFIFLKISIEFSFKVSIFQDLEEHERFFGNFLMKICLSFFIIDIFINFNTGYYEKGILVSNRVKISKKYLRSCFIFDGLSLIPIISDAFGGEKEFIIEILFVIRLKTFFRIFSQAQKSTHINFKAYNIIELLKILMRILLLTHILACVWHYIGLNQAEDFNSWLHFYELTKVKWWEKYIVSYYYISVTINTVGYGDIVPHTTIERLFGALFIFFACGIFAYTLNAIGTIVKRLQRKKDHFIYNLTTINEYMIKRNIRIDLRIRIQKYLEYVWKEESFQTTEEQSLIINKLSSSLKEELLLEANGTPLKNISFLRSNFSENTLRKLSYTMQEIRCTPGEIIFFKGEKTNHDMYFVRKGEIQIFNETNNKNKPCVINHIKKGGVFGEISFFTEQEREISAKSVNFTSIFVIKLSEFKRILAENFNDYQRYCQIKDKISIMNDYSDLNVFCLFCKTNGSHLSINCHNLHVRFSKKRILERNAASHFNERAIYKRIPKKRKHSYAKFQLFLEISKQFQKDLIDEENSEIASVQCESEEIKNDHKINEDSEGNEEVRFSMNNLLSKEIINSTTIGSNTNLNMDDNKLLPPRNSIRYNTAVPSNFFFHHDFDKLFTFEKYFPNNNCELVVLQSALIFENNLSYLKTRFKSNKVFLHDKRQFIKQLKEKKKTILCKDNEKFFKELNSFSSSSEIEKKTKDFFKKDSVKMINNFHEDKVTIKILLKKLAFKKQRKKIFGWIKSIKLWILDKN